MHKISRSPHTQSHLLSVGAQQRGNCFHWIGGDGRRGEWGGGGRVRGKARSRKRVVVTTGKQPKKKARFRWYPHSKALRGTRENNSDGEGDLMCVYVCVAGREKHRCSMLHT